MQFSSIIPLHKLFSHSDENVILKVNHRRIQSFFFPTKSRGSNALPRSGTANSVARIDQSAMHLDLTEADKAVEPLEEWLLEKNLIFRGNSA